MQKKVYTITTNSNLPYTPNQTGNWITKNFGFQVSLQIDNRPIQWQKTTAINHWYANYGQNNSSSL